MEKLECQIWTSSGKTFIHFNGAWWGNGSRCFFMVQLKFPHDLLARMWWGTSKRISARVTDLPNQEEIQKASQVLPYSWLHWLHWSKHCRSVAQMHLQKSRLSGALTIVHNAEIMFHITDTVILVDCSSHHGLHSCHLMACVAKVALQSYVEPCWPSTASDIACAPCRNIVLDE